MKLAYKIILANIALSFVIALLFALSDGGFHNAGDFAFGFGLTCLGIGLLNLFIGMLLLLSNQTEWRNGLLLSGAALLLLSGISCGGGLVSL